jgi:prolyl 4-hydroxylase
MLFFVLFCLSHDYIAIDKDRNPGPRILTAYMYLNDVEKGGGTNFPKLDVTVMPKRGRLLLWPSVLNDHPMEEDPITSHQALPVEAGEKYGANGWLHLRNFIGSLESGCT